MRAFAGCLLLLLLAACGDQQDPGHVVVYAHDAAREQRIEELLAEFTAETGTLVTLKFGASAELTDLVIGKRDAPRADVLLTVGAADILRAAENGALRPLADETLVAVPAVLRDADGYWIAARADSPVVAVADNAPTFALDGLADLGGMEFKGRLCLSSSALPANRALIAALIESTDNKTAERSIRAWMRNLALPPFASEARLVAALREGACEFGILGSSTHPEQSAHFWPDTEPRPLHIEGVGVARHATDADAAQRLVAWMATRQDKRIYDKARYVHAAVAGWRDEEARLLAERAGYR